MATNRKFQATAGKQVDLAAKPPGPPPDASKPYVYGGPDIGWKLVAVDDPEDRTPLPQPA
jgi:hypothetical protein